jgi:hypothetical protein
MVKTGLRLVMGSWKIMEISAPRSLRRLSSSSLARSWSLKSTLPALISPFGGSRRSSALATVLLPQPDSPTMPTIWPGLTSKLTSRSAVRMPSRV